METKIRKKDNQVLKVCSVWEREDISWHWDFRVFERKWDAEYDRAPWISGWHSLKSAQRPLWDHLWASQEHQDLTDGAICGEKDPGVAEGAMMRSTAKAFAFHLCPLGLDVSHGERAPKVMRWNFFLLYWEISVLVGTPPVFPGCNLKLVSECRGKGDTEERKRTL